MEQQSLADLGRSIQAALETRLHAWNADWPVDAILPAADGQELQRVDAAVQQVAALPEALLALEQWFTQGFLPPVDPSDTSTPDAPPRSYSQSALPPAATVTATDTVRELTPPTGSSVAAWSAEREDQPARPAPPPPTQAQAATSPPLSAGSPPAHAAPPGDMPDQSKLVYPAQVLPDQPGAAQPRPSAAPVTPGEQRSALPDPPAADPPSAMAFEQSAHAPRAPLGSLRDLAHLPATGNPETTALSGIAAASREADTQPQHPSNDIPTPPDGEDLRTGITPAIDTQPRYPIHDMPPPADGGPRLSDAAPPVHAQQRFHSSATLLPPVARETPPLSGYPADTEQRFPAEEHPTLPAVQSPPPAVPSLASVGMPSVAPPTNLPPVSATDAANPQPTPVAPPEPLPAQPGPTVSAFDRMQTPDLDRILEALAREIQREYTLFYEDS